MKCDIVFHPATTTVSRCCNMTFVKWWWQDITCSADGAFRPVRHQTSRKTLGWLWKIRHQYHQSTFCWPWKGSPVFLQMLFGHTATGQHDSGRRHRRRPCRTQCTGTCFYYYRSDTVMCQNTEHVLQGRLLTDDGGESCWMAAVAFDLQAPHCTVMRSNSVLAPLHLCLLPPPPPFSFILILLQLCLLPVAAPPPQPSLWFVIV